AFVAVVIVVLALIGAVYWISSEQERSATQVAHTQEVIASVATGRALLLDIQNGYRGYVLTGREAYREASDGKIDELRRTIATLRSLTANEFGQQARLQEFEGSLKPWIETMQRVATTRSIAGFPAAQQLVMSDLPRQQTLPLRAILDQVEQEERTLLGAYESDRAARLRAFWGLLSVLVGVMLAAIGVAFIHLRGRQREQERLLQSEQRFHLLAQNVVDYAIFLLDPQGHVVSWSAGAERMTGYTEDEIMGRHLSVFYTQEDRDAGKPDRELALASSNGRFEEEGWRLRKDGTPYWTSVVSTALRDRAGAVIGFGKLTHDLTERRRHEEALLAEVDERRAVEAQLHELNASLERTVAARTAELTSTNAELAAARDRLEDLWKQLVAAQEDERRRISRELHDETGGTLSLIRLRLDDALRSSERRVGHIEECTRMVDSAVRQIRSVARNLRPSVLDDLGLADALESVLEQHAEASGWHTQMSADPIGRLSPELETTCFRIGQEALTNVARHAKATFVEIGLHASNDALELVVRDNGAGFDSTEARSSDMRRRHFGLVSMSERANLAGGRLEVESAPGQGTRLRVTLPLAATG
ncbi:MAG: CHASE3 domain-containing protein, partial [Rudaea sp.]